MLFIAEIGINHNGDMDNVKKLIDMAADCGADVVKFQKRTPSLCVPEKQKNVLRETPWGQMTYLEYKERVELTKENYDYIDEYCKVRKIKWTASVWDIESVNFLMQYDVPFIKIPSAMLTDWNLLKVTKETRKPIIMSTGMSNLKEIYLSTAYLSCGTTIPDISLLHCNSSYPALDNELDLLGIKFLKASYPRLKIGYSGHEEGIEPSIVAAAIGAEIIERHITLDKKMWGTDQKASLEKDELKRLVTTVKNIPTWLGKQEIICYDSEKKVRDKLRNVDQ